MIHPTAIISPKAKLHPTVEVGPCAVIDQGVELGESCVVGPHVYMTGQTIIGARNRFHAGCVIGDAPQDLKYGGAPTRLRIGDDNVFREHVTVHRATDAEGETVIGAKNYLMAGSHVGHNSQLHNQIILANGALLGGHVQIFDRALVSGNCAVHQFVRVGTLAIMQGTSGASADVPPYTVMHRVNELCGLNIIGLRRAGATDEERLELKQLYRLLFRSGHSMQKMAEQALSEFKSKAAQTLIAFVLERGSKRTICTDSAFRRGDGVE